MAVPRCAWGRSRRTPVPTPHSEGQPPRLATPAVGPLRHLGWSWTATDAARHGALQSELCGRLGDDGGVEAAYRGGCSSLPEPLKESDTPWKALPTSSGCVSLTRSMIP